MLCQTEHRGLFASASDQRSGSMKVLGVLIVISYNRVICEVISATGTFLVQGCRQ